MINGLNFFTPIRYEQKDSCWQVLVEGIEEYFYLGGKSAFVIPGQTSVGSLEVEIKNTDKNKIIHVIICAVKIAICVMMPVPAVIMLAVKIVFRATHRFHSKKLSSSSGKTTATFKTHHNLGVNSTSDNCRSSVASLMNKFDSLKKDTYFDANRFAKCLSEHAKRFKKEGFNTEEHFGYIEKFDLKASEKPQIYVRADLHGDLKSLMENLKSLQQQGLLDKNFQCKPGVHLVFLGDYCDNGDYIVEVLEMLMCLREENEGQVHLIRGNHEHNLSLNQGYGKSDPDFMKIVENSEGKKALEAFYETLSLTTYIGVEGEKREYVQFTHGLFEPTMDPAPLLDEKKSGEHILVKKERKLSERIEKIADGVSDLSESAQRIQEIVTLSTELTSPHYTAYNWADVSEKDSEFGNLGSRKYKLNAQDIRHYLDLSSEQHRVVMLFRGHQHKFQHLKHKEEVLVTTLSVGMNSNPQNYKKGSRYNCEDQSDRAYIIQTDVKVSQWQKKAIVRAPSSSTTDRIEGPFPLTSSEI